MRQKPNLAQNLLFLYLCRSFRSFTFRSISNWSYMCSISEVICLSVTPSTIHTKHCTIFTSSSLEAFFSCMDMPSKMLLRLRRTLGGRWDSGMAVPGFSGSTVAYMRSPARTEPMHLTWITPITQTTSVSSKRKRETPNYTEIGDLLCRCYDTEKCMYVKFTWITLFTNSVFLYCCWLYLRDCLHDTGATFAPEWVHSGSLSWLYICLHDTTTKCPASESHPGVSSPRSLYRGENFTPVRNLATVSCNDHTFRCEIGLPVDGNG